MRRNVTLYCPQCGGSFLLITEQKMYCLNCRLIFNRKVLNNLLPDESLPKGESKTKESPLNSIAKQKN
ncbi:MAG: hypothetical protein P8Y23_03640 [Candidatus Lokiarchaeota archaeon]|jgi:hypothetical protein